MDRAGSDHKITLLYSYCLVQLRRPKVVISLLLLVYLLVKQVTSLIAFRSESFISLAAHCRWLLKKEDERQAKRAKKRKPLRNP